MNVLLVEDDQHYTALVKRTLARHQHLAFNLICVETLDAALCRLERKRFDVILVDLNLPDTQGIESVERITLARNRIPVVVLSNNADEDLAIRVIQAGAQDYLVKGNIGLETLHRTIRYSIERKAAEFRLKQLASYDGLTNLANRQELYFQLEKACAHADRHGEMVALFLFDLDKFKLVNDTHGHHVGDALLRAFAKQLEASIRVGDTASRLGGDEFAIILEGIPHAGAAEAWVKKTLERLKEPFEFEGQTFSMSASIGCALYPAHGDDVNTLMHNSDVAMYKVKKTGRSGVAFYDTQMDQSIIRRKQLESTIRAALEAGEFQAYYQPKLSLDTYKIVGFEALCRWLKPDGSVVMPGEFMPVARDYGLLPEIGKVMRTNVIDALKQWKSTPGINHPVAINVDTLEISVDDFSERLLSDLKDASIDSSLVKIEIREEVLVEKNEIILNNLQLLKNGGIGITLDGFGSGHASLHYLRKFWIDSLKLDQSIIDGIGDDMESLYILKAIIKIGREIGLEIVAKGIETANQLRRLSDMGCGAGQGYLIGRPMTIEEVVIWHSGPAKRLQLRLENITDSVPVLLERDTCSYSHG